MYSTGDLGMPEGGPCPRGNLFPPPKELFAHPWRDFWGVRRRQVYISPDILLKLLHLCLIGPIGASRGSNPWTPRRAPVVREGAMWRRIPLRTCCFRGLWKQCWGTNRPKGQQPWLWMWKEFSDAIEKDVSGGVILEDCLAPQEGEKVKHPSCGQLCTSGMELCSPQLRRP